MWIALLIIFLIIFFLIYKIFPKGEGSAVFGVSIVSFLFFIIVGILLIVFAFVILIALNN